MSKKIELETGVLLTKSLQKLELDEYIEIPIKENTDLVKFRSTVSRYGRENKKEFKTKQIENDTMLRIKRVHLNYH